MNVQPFVSQVDIGMDPGMAVMPRLDLMAGAIEMMKKPAARTMSFIDQEMD